MNFMYSREEVNQRVTRAIVAAASVGIMLGFVLGWFVAGGCQ